MGHTQKGNGHNAVAKSGQTGGKYARIEDIVLDKGIFSNVFEKDIRRVFIYKKAERLAKALHLITPAFFESASLRNRIDAIAMGLVDAAVLPPSVARAALSRELLTLSSVLSIARTGGLLSIMNTELITHEAHALLQEIAEYEEPRLFLDDAPTLSGIAKSAPKKDSSENAQNILRARTTPTRVAQDASGDSSKGHIKDRKEAIMSVIRSKGSVSIKDVSTHIRGVSEKTIQRELGALIDEGVIAKQGERRWSTYSLV